MDEQITIPTWLARSIVPVALIAALGASFSMWRDVLVMGARLDNLEPRIEEFEQFRLRGKRFTADDGKGLEKRISILERRLDRDDIRHKFDHPRSKP